MNWLKENWFRLITLLLFFVTLGFLILSFLWLNLEKKKTIAENCTTFTAVLPKNDEVGIGKLFTPSQKSTKDFSELNKKCLEFFNK